MARIKVKKIKILPGKVGARFSLGDRIVILNDKLSIDDAELIANQTRGFIKMSFSYLKED